MKILIAVIAYNEEKNIKNVLLDLQKHNCGYHIVVIDNASSDRTAAISREMGVGVVSHCINANGQFGTLPTYFKYARLYNYDVLCQFDGDGQHRASELPKIIQPILEGRADYVIGSRFIEKKGFQSYFFRRIGIRLFSQIDSLLIRSKVTDTTSGFRAYSRKVITFFADHYKHVIPDTNQLLLLSRFMGAEIAEVPVKMDERRFGKSEFDVFRSFTFIVKGLVNIMVCMLQRSQLQRHIRRNDGSKD